MEHKDFDEYIVYADENNALYMSCNRCSVKHYCGTQVYASYITRAIAQHDQVCAVVNAVGRHSK